VKKAYQLVEVLITLSLFTIFCGAVFAILGTGQRSWTLVSLKQELSAQADQGMRLMLRELYLTSVSQIQISPTGEEITFQLPIGYSTSGDLKWGVGGQEGWEIRYLVSGQRLLRRVLDINATVQEEGVLANNISNLSFSLSGRRLDISLVAAKSAPRTGEVLSVPLSSSITLRN